jgi:cytochrome c-type biogenesis protein
MTVNPGAPIGQPQIGSEKSPSLIRYVPVAAGWLALLAAVVLAFRPTLFSAALNFNNASAAANTNPPGSNFAGNLGVSIGLVFLAGVVSFVSPCVLPILPGYLTYLAARSSGREIGRASRRQVLFHGIAFVAGFSIVFITLGATASVLGRFLFAYKEWITRIGGVFIVFFGLQMAGLLKVPFLEFEIRKHAEPNPRLGYLSSLLMGMFFSAGWTPCIGPTLGIVLIIAGSGAALGRGILLLALYSLGLGLPFIIAALAIDWLGGWMRRLAKLTRYVTLAAGVFLAGVGILLILGQLNFLGQFLPGLAIYL